MWIINDRATAKQRVSHANVKRSEYVFLAGVVILPLSGRQK